MTSLQDPASARWRELLDTDQPILADGAMGTMLFASGLAVRRPARGLEPRPTRTSSGGSTAATSTPARGILLTNTFGGNRLRLALHGHDDARR